MGELLLGLSERKRSMIFSLTNERIADCRKLIGMLRASRSDLESREVLAHSSVNSIRSIWDCLCNEGLRQARAQGVGNTFKGWLNSQRASLETKPLFALVNDSRNEYFHGRAKVVKASNHVTDLHIGPEKASYELTSKGLIRRRGSKKKRVNHPGIRVRQAIRSVPAPMSNVKILGGPFVVNGGTVNMDNFDIGDSGETRPDQKERMEEECEAALQVLESVVRAAEEKFGEVQRTTL